jgi:uncharacterized tellurite resistance protein B-like protein
MWKGETDAKYADLQLQIEAMRFEMAELTKEKDFYFEKLHEIEVICTEAKETRGEDAVLQRIVDTLYSKSEDVCND